MWHGQAWVCPLRSWDSIAVVFQEWMNELSWFFAYSYMVSGKLKVTLGMHMVKYGWNLLGPEQKRKIDQYAKRETY